MITEMRINTKITPKGYPLFQFKEVEVRLVYGFYRVTCFGQLLN